MKSKDITELCKGIFVINKLFIQCDTGSCSEHRTGGVNYIYMCVCWSTDLCTYCVSLFVCVISSQSSGKKTCYVLDLRKLDALLRKTHSKVLVLSWRSTYEDHMWCDQPFIQRNKVTKRPRGWDKIWTRLEKGEGQAI